MAVRTLQQSFSGGEMSQDMYGRVDDAKYQSGAATLKNFIVRPQGPAENRSGFEFVREVRDADNKTRLIPFTHSTDQTMVVEIGDQYIRFHTEGATLVNRQGVNYEWTRNYKVGESTRGGDGYYYALRDNRNIALSNANYWYRQPDTREYEVPTPWGIDDVFDLKFVQSADVMTVTHPSYDPVEIRRLGALQWEIKTVQFFSLVGSPSGVSGVASGNDALGAEKYEYTYVVTSVGEDGITESPQSTEITVKGNVLQTGGIVTLNWSSVLEATRYRAYKLQGGIFGYIGETETLSIVDDNIAPDLSYSPPRYDNTLSGADNHPNTVSYFEQRRAFAGTNNRPQNIWMTKAGTETNLSFSLPTRDSDRIAFRVAAREANSIRHIVPMNDLMLMTSSVEWRVTSVNSDAITPNTISVRPQSFVGSSNVQPVIINNSVVFCAARGGHVREMGYNFQAGGYITGDLCLRSNHLFDGSEIVQMGYAKAPDPVVWMVNNKGLLLGLTYVPEQNIGAWHHHTTDGEFESCCVVAEGSEDRLYVVVKRTISGETKRYIERMAQRELRSIERAFFVDSGLRYKAGNQSGQLKIIGDGIVVKATKRLFVDVTEVEVEWSSQLFDSVYNEVGTEFVFYDEFDEPFKFRFKRMKTPSVAVMTPEKPFPRDIWDKFTNNWNVAVTEIAGLDHLEGKEVNILADGAVHPKQTVIFGKVAFDRPVLDVVVGLPIVADIKSLPLGVATQDGSFGQGRIKNVNKVWLRVVESSGIFVGADEESLVENKQRTDEVYGAAPDLYSGEVQIELRPSWGQDGQILVRQIDPLPLTIVSITHEVVIGG